MKHIDFRMNTRSGSVLQRIVRKGICSGCGCCEVVCLERAIEMRLNRYGQIEPYLIGHCTMCGKCLKVCPFYEENNENNRHDINEMLFGDFDAEFHPIIGKYASCYLGNAIDEKINLGGTSGGMVSLMLMHLLKTAKINAAVVTSFTSKKGYMFEMKVVKSVGAVLNSAKSKYYPTTCSGAIKEIITSGEKFAFVGLPCHVYGLRRIQKNFPDKLRNLVYVFGLICGQNKSSLFTDFLIRSLNLSPVQVLGLDYRDKGKTRSDNYSFLVTGYKNGKMISKRLPNLNSIYNQLFTQRCFSIGACKYCDDIYSELADVSFMDAWLPECMKNYKGESIVISRSKEISAILEEMKFLGDCYLKNINIENVLKSQRGVIRYKRQLLPGRLSLWNSKKGNIITQRIKPSKHNLRQYWNEHFTLIFNEKLTNIIWSIKIARTKIIARILLYLTSKIGNQMISAPLVLLLKIKKILRIRRKICSILVLGQGTIRNRGCEAILSKTMDLLDQPLGSMKFIVPMFLYDNKYDKEYSKKQLHKLEIFPVFRCTFYSICQNFKRKFYSHYQYLKRKLGIAPIGYELGHRVDNRILNLSPYYRKADFVIAVGGDNYTTLGASMKNQIHLNMLKNAIHMGKKTIISAASIGPFRKTEEKWIAKILNKVDLITVRETITLDYLKSLGVVDNVKLVADPAYLIKAERIDVKQYWNSYSKRITIGINIAGKNISSEKKIDFKTYINIFVNFIEKAIDRYKANILLIPHVTIDEFSQSDLESSVKVYEQLKGNKRIAILKEYLNVSQTKYIISQCDFYIGSRMHSTISSLSSLVPTLAIAYSIKYKGIFRNHFGHDEFVIDIDELNEELLFNKMDLLLSKRDEIIETIRCSLKDAIDGAKQNGNYIRSQLNDAKRIL